MRAGRGGTKNEWKGRGQDRACSVQAAASEVIGNDDVGHSVEHHLDISCICGAGHVTVDFLVWRTVLALELCLDVSGCVVVGVGSCTENETD